MDSRGFDDISEFDAGSEENEIVNFARLEYFAVTLLRYSKKDYENMILRELIEQIDEYIILNQPQESEVSED